MSHFGSRVAWVPLFKKVSLSLLWGLKWGIFGLIGLASQVFNEAKIGSFLAKSLKMTIFAKNRRFLICFKNRWPCLYLKSGGLASTGVKAVENHRFSRLIFRKNGPFWALRLDFSAKSGIICHFLPKSLVVRPKIGHFCEKSAKNGQKWVKTRSGHWFWKTKISKSLTLGEDNFEGFAPLKGQNL